MLMLKSTHLLKMEIERLKFESLALDFQRHRSASQHTEMQFDELVKTNTALAEANAKLTIELLILRNTVNARRDAETSSTTDHLMQPDISVESEDERGQRIKRDSEDMEAIRQELERGLNELAGEVDISSVTPEAIAEASVASVEEWRKQHDEQAEEL